MARPKTLLIRPPLSFTAESIDYLSIVVPIGLAYVAANLEEHGYPVEILDLPALGYDGTHKDEEGFIQVGMADAVVRERISQYRPDIVGITNPFTSQARNMFRTAALVKSIDSSLPVVVGGVHPSSEPLGCMADPNVDYVVVQEGEETMLDLLRFLEGGQDLQEIPSLYYRTGGEVRLNGLRPLIKNLDGIPFPAYHLLPMSKYAEAARLDMTVRGGHHEPWCPIVTSRGCPYRCSFCSVHVMEGRGYRSRSAENVVDEIGLLVSHYGVRTFVFEDSVFNLRIERAEAICDEIVRRGLKIRFSLSNGVRADRITERLAVKMKAAGCQEISLAIEHGDQQFLNDVIGKRLDLSKVEDSVRAVRRAGISASGFFIIGIPPESKKTVSKTIALGKRLAKIGMIPLINIAMPLPHTALYDAALRDGYLSKELDTSDYLLVSHSKPLLRSEGLSPEDLIGLRRRMYVECAFTLLVHHPLTFLRLPFVRSTLSDFKNLHTIGRRIHKLRSLLNV